MHLFQLIQKPTYQGLLFVIFTLILAFVLRPRNADHAWVICGLVYGVFILTNSILAFYTISIWQYFFISIGISLLYLLVIALVVKILINSLKLEGPEESAMIFIIIIFHPVALLFSIFLKWVFLKIG